MMEISLLRGEDPIVRSTEMLTVSHDPPAFGERRKRPVKRPRF